VGTFSNESLEPVQKSTNLNPGAGPGVPRPLRARGDPASVLTHGWGAATRRVAAWLAGRHNAFRFAAGLIALLALFALYAKDRQRWVGACDWYGYYEEARLFTQGRLTMPSALDVGRYPALAPLAFVPMGGRIVPQYPPGFPLLLAAAMPFGLEYFVPALCTALFVWVMYLTLRHRVSRAVAWSFAGVWAVFPIVLAGARGVLSDLPAALGLLACFHLLADRDRPVAAGLVFAFSVAIRPTNALFGILLLPMFGNWRRLLRFAVPAAVLGCLYGAYNWDLFGAPWRTGYSWMHPHLTPSVFRQYFAYYGTEVLRQFTPLLVLPALWAVVVRRGRGVFLLAWFLVFWAFYSLWAAGGDLWWWLRFLLPGLPALFVLGVDGVEDLRTRLERWRPRWRPVVRGGVALLVAAVAANVLAFDRREALFGPNIAGKCFYDFALSAKQRLPAGALVGSWEASGALRLYGGFESFVLLSANAPTLIEESVAAGRKVYVLMEPSLREHRFVFDALARFDTGDEVLIKGFERDVRALRVLGTRRTIGR